MIRVVLDTNIVISAVLKAGSLPEAVFNMAVDDVIELCVSEPILAEYEEVPSRVRLGIPAKKVACALLHIREESLLVTATAQVAADACPRDRDDIMFLSNVPRNRRDSRGNQM